MKFSTKLSFVILLTGIITLVIFSFLIFKFSSEEVIKSQFSQTNSIATKVADDFDHLLSEKVKTALTLANTPIIKNALETSNFFYTNLSDEKRKESIKLLNEHWKSTKDPTDQFIQKFTDNKASHFLKNQQIVLNDEYGEIFLTNKFGALVASTSKLSTFAHGHKYWWLGSYNNGVGTVFFDDRGYDDSVGGYVLGLVVPIKKGKEVIGILKCNLNILGNISELILGAEDKLIGKFKLIRSGGMVVFEEGFEPLSTQIHDDIFKKIKNRNNEMFILNDSGEKYLVGFSEVNMTKGKNGYGFGGTFESIDHKKGNTGESWYILCYRKVSLARAPMIKLIKWGGMVGTLIISILVLVSHLFAKKIAKPLLILDKATRKIGKGDFEYRIELRRKDEFGTLAHSFNSMTSRLHRTTTSIKLLEKEVTERKKAEKALQISKERLDLAIIGTKAGLWDWNVQTGETIFNEWWANIVGYTLEELSPISINTWIDLVHPDDLENSNKLLEKHFAGKTDYYTCEVRIKHKNGHWVWIQDSGKISEWGEDGKPLRMTGTHIDITERRTAEKKREQLIKELQEALENIKTLSGLLPICAHCKKIRDDKGYWNQIEGYIQTHSDAEFSHGMCPECSDKLYGDEDWYIEMKKEKEQKK